MPAINGPWCFNNHYSRHHCNLLVSLQSRRRELAIFRALGVKPYQLLSLILIEAFLVCLSGIILGWFVLQG